MRKIKFRGKTQEGTWVFGHLTKFEYPDNEEKNPLCFIWVQSEDMNTISKIQVDHNTVGQFTGLVDRNGVEMYDGDEFTTIWKSKENTVQEGVVYWNYLKGSWDAKNATFPSRSRRTTQVIGNIHEQ